MQDRHRLELPMDASASCSSETVDDELLDLFTCHRKDAHQIQYIQVCSDDICGLPKLYEIIYKPFLQLQDDIIPFPWKKPSLGPDGGAPHTAELGTKQENKNSPEPVRKPLASIAGNPGIKSIVKNCPKGQRVGQHIVQMEIPALYENCARLGCITFNLPPQGSLAGRVLQHASREMEKLFQDHEPMIWKVGYTHNPAWRWANKMYGYAQDIAKWERMEVLYLSKEPFGPAMLEAMLIDKFQGTLATFPRAFLQGFRFCCYSICCFLGFVLDRDLLARQAGVPQHQGWWRQRAKFNC